MPNKKTENSDYWIKVMLDTKSSDLYKRHALHRLLELGVSLDDIQTINGCIPEDPEIGQVILALASKTLLAGGAGSRAVRHKLNPNNFKLSV